LELHEKKAIEELREAFKDWENKHEDDFKTESKSFATESGIPIKRVYTPLDLADKGFDYLRDVGFPGEYPYTRSHNAIGYRAKFWERVAYSGHADPVDTNKIWRAQIDAGQTTINVAYDLPCQQGLDPDDPMAEGEIGRVGLTMVTQMDWEAAFDGIDLRKIGINQTLSESPAMVGLANHTILAHKRGMEDNEIVGLLQGDSLKEHLSRGNYIFSPQQGVRLVGDTLSYVGAHLPRYQAITVCGVALSEKGANKIHEAAYALANGFAYLQAAVDRGVDVDQLAPTMMFQPGCDHYCFWEEIAKYRAMRKIWAKVLRDRFKARKPASLQCRFYAGHGGSGLFREQYLNNIGRITLATFAAALSGVQFVDARTYDEQFGIPSQQAVVDAVRFQNVVAYETGVDSTVDPLAGSYFIECLTLETEERVWKELKEVDDRGGIVKCIENGYAQSVIAKDGYQAQRKLESGQTKRIGFNIYRSVGEEQKPIQVYRADPALDEKRKNEIMELKKKRDSRKVRKSLEEIKAIAVLEASASNNLVPPIMGAVAAYATNGEICRALKDVWGGFREAALF